MADRAPYSDPTPAPGGKRHRHHASSGQWALALGALGVVFGDIGTSPLYALQTVFGIDNGSVHPTRGDVLGVMSLAFWSITLVVSIKYVLFILRADNDGEGGIMALSALVKRAWTGSPAKAAAFVGLGVIGASLFYGDSVITPAISVLSAVEGLKVAAPSISNLVLPISLTLITILFLGQRFGTKRVGTLFGPVMIVWFAALGVAGAHRVVTDPAIIKGLSPTYAGLFIADHPYIAFIAMGAVVLTITGAEALYADMGHFGRKPIKRAWFFLVFPALTLNYLGQSSLILKTPTAISNPFFLLLPHWSRIPMVVLASAATIIASQAVISGAFSVSRQAMQLGFLPRLTVRHTGEHEAGQVYVPAVNWLLFAAVVVVCLKFPSSASLATAYGVAVTGTFIINTVLFLAVARALWHWQPWKLALAGVIFLSVEVTFFAANVAKVLSGGWLPLLIAAGVVIVMLTWERGRLIVTGNRNTLEGDLATFIRDVNTRHVPRVRGTAVFPHPNNTTTPFALRANVKHNGVLHNHVVIVSAETENVPHILPAERVTVDDLGYADDGIFFVTARFGFQDAPDLPAALRLAAAKHPEMGIDVDGASYFLSRIRIQRTAAPGLSGWRKRLFVGLARNAANPAEYFRLPNDRTVVVGAEVPV
jgi:KUP system potassium uptake protein